MAAEPSRAAAGPGDASEEALRAAKRALRETVLAARAALDAASRAAACAAITRRLLDRDSWRKARTVSAYWSFGSEFDTAALIAQSLRAKKRLVLPRIDRAARALVFHVVTDLDADLLAGTWGIREPDPARCPAADLREIEFMLVPGVAFTRECDRLGYGGGYYDRVLEGLPAGCRAVSAAFSVQIVETLPLSPRDQKVDAVVTESGCFGLADQDWNHRSPGHPVT
ncbi:MAG TPA: 5-formyltetrahydrofolate cyclo-ligase [Burkholderiales bacterium]|jgi:5,10-methenyltetrahydrofolate synthetase|nr:5-formyltetrahydrofolate cyclo-ligase [Burkholderiales bacterium]